MSASDFYSLLGVPPDADTAEIRKAWIRTSRILHPDRFDAKTQHEDWQHANHMLSKVNEAWQVLKDPEKRAKYDAARGFNRTGAAAPRPGARPRPGSRPRTEPEESGPDPTESLKSGHSKIDLLPESLRRKFLPGKKAVSPDQYYVITDSVSGKYVGLLLSMLWFPVLFIFAAGREWHLFMTISLFAATTGIAWFAGMQAFWLYRHLRTGLDCRLYITPLYLVETRFEQIRWWPISDINKVEVNDKNYNPLKPGTQVYIGLNGGSREYLIRPRQMARNWIASLRHYDLRLRDARNRKRYSYIRRNDGFAGMPGSSGSSDKFVESRSRYFIMAVPVILGLIIFGSAWISNLGNTQPISERMITHLLPPNGTRMVYHEQDAHAPLTIEAPADRHYLVKINYEQFDFPLMTVFVRAGHEVNLSVPEGRYTIRYATGTRWYGSRDFFGSDTRFYAENRIFDFSFDDGRVIGHRLTLNDPDRMDGESIYPIDREQFRILKK